MTDEELSVLEDIRDSLKSIAEALDTIACELTPRITADASDCTLADSLGMICNALEKRANK